MKIVIGSKERFRKGFVLILTIGYGLAFILLISGFFKALLLAAVFSGIVYPLYLWFLNLFGGRSSLASFSTLVIYILVLVIPLIFLLGLVAEQAIEVTEKAKPWIEHQIEQSHGKGLELPGWVPFSDKIEPYKNVITKRLAEITEKVGVILAGHLAALSAGAAVFFLHLFVMLYAQHFFLTRGPRLMRNLMSYGPLSEKENEKIIQTGLAISLATVKGTLVIGVIQGALGGFGFWVAGIGAAVFWGAVIAAMSIIPGIGSTLVWAPAVVYLLISGETVAGLGLLGWCAGVVGSIDNFLRPVIVGRDSDMSNLLVLLSTLGGIAFFGISGLVFGPLLAALFQTILMIYSNEFSDWLTVDDGPEDHPRKNVTERLSSHSSKGA
ncbi:MAG: AI-2E family transporter [Desulforhopalus sp.]